MRVVLKWFLTIMSLFILGFFAYQTALFPSEFNIICTIIITFVTIVYIICVFKEFNDFND